jgi:hypothetical protein
LLRTALTVVVVTWLPGWIGGVLALPLFRWWGVISGYAGLSWLLPGFLVGLAAARVARRGGLRLDSAVGVMVGGPAVIVLLIGAGYLVGG